jgi:hypothetical protein
MDPTRWQLAAGVLLVAGGAAMFVVGYTIGGLTAVAIGVATTLARK